MIQLSAGHRAESLVLVPDHGLRRKYMLYKGQDASKLSFYSSAYYCRNIFMKLKYVGKYIFNLMVLLNVFDRTWSFVASCVKRPMIIRQE